jgi:xylulokinase
MSDLWCQIHADVLDRTIERVDDPLHANLRGAALFAALALGEMQRQDIHELVPVERVFAPRLESRVIYDRLYAEFPRLYKAQRAMFGRLNAAAG